MASPSLSSLWITGEANGFPRPFGNYLLLAAFAQGGMGELFLAMNGSIAGAFRLCVVKKLRADLTNDKEYVNRFVDEAKVVVQLNHANISHVFDIGRIEGQYYLAMEYVSGVSVKRLMARAEELDADIPEEIGVHIARGVLDALDYAHAHTHPISGEALHVVHRDVSPQNVLVSWAGEVKLIDFGLALSAMKDEHTATGAVMGKVAYMPPEQARGEEVGPACDQFATAIVTYEMLAGDRYHGDLPMHAIWAIAGMGNFPPPKWSRLPRELQIILQRALHNDPFRRYPSCGDLKEALGAYMAAHHPATSGRHLRDLLEKWFKDYKGEERELLAQFKDVTGTKIREAVKGSLTAVESLVSGPHARPAGWQMPPTENDARAISGSGPVSAAPPASGGVSSSGPVAPSPGASPAPAGMSAALNLGLSAAGSVSDGRLEESRSMRLMPPPALGGASAAVAEAAAALLSPPVSPANGPILAPPVLQPVLQPVSPPLSPLAPPSSGVPLATVGESTAQFMRGPNATMVPVGSLTPRSTVGESTERLVREAAGGNYPVLVPLAQGGASAPSSPAVTSPVVTPPAASPAPAAVAQPVVAPAVSSSSAPIAPAEARPRSAIARHEPTERFRRAEGSSADDDMDFDSALRRPVWPYAAAALAVVAVVVAIAVASSGGADDVATNPVVTPPVGSDVHTDVPADLATDVKTDVKTGAGIGSDAGTAVIDTPPVDVAVAPVGSPKSGKHPKPRDKTVDKKVTPPTAVDVPVETAVDNRDAVRARERVDALRRSACKDPCVSRIVGQLETMPGAVDLDGFRKSVGACVEVCRNK